MPERVPVLNLKHEATFFGPNPFSTDPVVVASITLADGDSSSADAWVQACLVLGECFPEWIDPPGPSGQNPLAEVGRTAACWALAVLNETHGFLHAAGVVPRPRNVLVWLGFHHPELSLLALKTVLSLLGNAAHSRDIDRAQADSALESIWQLCRSYHPDDMGRILMQGARALDIPVLPFITESVFWQYGWGCRSRVFGETSSNADGNLGGRVADSKILSKMAFAELGIPTPKYRVITQPDELPDAVKAVGWPCVVKPVSQRGGKGVTAGIMTLSEAEAAFAIASRYRDEATMIEEFVPGDDHRLLVIDGRFFAALRRESSSVTGDGRSTVAKLIATLNSGRSRNRVKSRYRAPITVDDVIEQHLQRQGVSLDTVLDARRRITLRGNANLATGGVCVDVTSEVHPDTRRMAETAARAIGLTVAGFDFITTDIARPWQECGALIEVNVSPGVFGLISMGRKPVSVASAILGTAPARIPIRLVVTPRSELPQVLEHLRGMPPTPGFGWACDAEAALAGMPLRVVPAKPWRPVATQGAMTLLRHGSLQRACVVCPIDALIRHGMPVDKAESAILYRCGSMPLTALWMKVLGDHSGTISIGSDWTDLQLADFTTRRDELAAGSRGNIFPAAD